MRWALVLEYDGSDFHGWQAQSGLRTVQAEVEQALSNIADQSLQIIAAGRTDAGVHATHQVIHFDTLVQRSLRDWVIGTNHYLPKDISIRSAHPVSENFHARFSALARSYEYRIDNHSSRPALQRNRVAWMPRPINVSIMHTAAQQLVGTHDFSAFRASDCQAQNPIRTITQLNIKKRDDLIILQISANAFLHHMVRNIVGTLLPIGFGFASAESLQEILQNKQRAQAGITAPAAGLYLCDVKYSSVIFNNT